MFWTLLFWAIWLVGLTTSTIFLCVITYLGVNKKRRNATLTALRAAKTIVDSQRQPQPQQQRRAAPPPTQKKPRCPQMKPPPANCIKNKKE